MKDLNIKLNGKQLSIGFIGAGNMGLPMIRNLIKAKFNVKVFDINSKITKNLDRNKITTVNNLRAIANSNYVISMLPDTNHVEDVFNEKTGINQFMNAGTIVIDMSTISSKATIEIAKKLQKKQIQFLDAPVSGGVTGAIDGTLSIMVGGKK